ncbi:MAG: hypothetical protein ACREDL_06930 [Bradyrhizobium sp.]
MSGAPNPGGIAGEKVSVRMTREQLDAALADQRSARGARGLLETLGKSLEKVVAQFKARADLLNEEEARIERAFRNISDKGRADKTAEIAIEQRRQAVERERVALPRQHLAIEAVLVL